VSPVRLAEVFRLAEVVPLCVLQNDNQDPSSLYRLVSAADAYKAQPDTALWKRFPAEKIEMEQRHVDWLE